MYASLPILTQLLFHLSPPGLRSVFDGPSSTKKHKSQTGSRVQGAGKNGKFDCKCSSLTLFVSHTSRLCLFRTYSFTPFASSDSFAIVTETPIELLLLDVKKSKSRPFNPEDIYRSNRESSSTSPSENSARRVFDNPDELTDVLKKQLKTDKGSPITWKDGVPSMPLYGKGKIPISQRLTANKLPEEIRSITAKASTAYANSLRIPRPSGTAPAPAVAPPIRREDWETSLQITIEPYFDDKGNLKPFAEIASYSVQMRLALEHFMEKFGWT